MKALILLSAAFSPKSFWPWPSKMTCSSPSISDCLIIFLSSIVESTKKKQGCKGLWVKKQAIKMNDETHLSADWRAGRLLV